MADFHDHCKSLAKLPLLVQLSNDAAKGIAQDGPCLGHTATVLDLFVKKYKELRPDELERPTKKRKKN